SQESYLGLVAIDPESITVIDASAELASTDAGATDPVQEPANFAAANENAAEGNSASEAAL
ncbi:MAG: hypothetical protein KJ052_18170, partial [Candidatus Hydrogenedentes bacterium]|nr:hypothetical protein [Candidatus Hydrogenedentota bacterium]